MDPVQDAISRLPVTLLQFGEPTIFEDEEGTSQGQSALISSSATTMGVKAEHPVAGVFRRQLSVLSEVPVLTAANAKLLHALLPPREVPVNVAWDAHGNVIRRKRIVQPVSEVQASRSQLAELRELLDFKLADARARSSGTCPVRRMIFSMLFDELVRQTVIDCPERGLLLLRIRDQLRMTYDATCILYEESLHQTRRRMFEAMRQTPELTGKVANLTDQCDTLRQEVLRLEAQHVAVLRSAEERQQTDQKKHGEEMLFLERTKQRLIQHIDRVKELHEEERRRMRGEQA